MSAPDRWLWTFYGTDSVTVLGTWPTNGVFGTDPLVHKNPAYTFPGPGSWFVELLAGNVAGSNSTGKKAVSVAPIGAFTLKSSVKDTTAVSGTTRAVNVPAIAVGDLIVVSTSGNVAGGATSISDPLTGTPNVYTAVAAAQPFPGLTWLTRTFRCVATAAGTNVVLTALFPGPIDYGAIRVAVFSFTAGAVLTYIGHSEGASGGTSQAGPFDSGTVPAPGVGNLLFVGRVDYAAVAPSAQPAGYTSIDPAGAVGYSQSLQAAAGRYQPTYAGNQTWIAQLDVFAANPPPAGNTPPTIAITSPTSNPTWPTASPTIGLSGTATDDLAVTSVTWVNDRGGSGSASVVGTTAATWSIPSIALQTGLNNLDVTAHDANGNLTTVRLAVTYTPLVFTPVPPDLMRGFGTVRGAGASDMILIPLTSHSTDSGWMGWDRREETALPRTIFTKSTQAIQQLTERLRAGVDGGVATLHFERQWSGGSADWYVPAPAPGTRYQWAVGYTAAPSFVPLIWINGVPQTVTTIRQPGGGETVVNSAANYMLGNFPGGLGNRGGDMAKWVKYARVPTQQDVTDFVNGVNPMTIGVAPVAYHPLSGTANAVQEPAVDSVTSTGSTVTGTKVQNYAAPPPPTVALAVTSGNPAGNVAYQITATTTGTVNRVEFDIAGSLFATRTVAPYLLFTAPTLLGAGPHTIVARVYETAVSAVADTKTLVVTEPSPVSGTWLRDYEADRVANADSYKFYVNNVLADTKAQPATGKPLFTVTLIGGDITPLLEVTSITGGVESARTAMTKHYVNPSLTAPEGFREIARAFDGTTWAVTYRVNRKPAPALSYDFSLDGGAAVNILQPASGNPIYATSFTGASVTKLITVNARYAGGPGPALTTSIRYVAPATNAPTGFQDLGGTFTP